ncbi:MAG: RHS repeat-associated core domain-containing protein, partial [Betaproteobacteria bacterium]|nr:RHS repeat-associated core domain-containing protein [Betaproteobacteria bacterium]
VNNVRFPGQYYDAETGLSYNLNRSYDPTVGRYLEPDPLGLAAGTNLYAYTGDDPVNLTDPLGLETPSVSLLNAPGKMGDFGSWNPTITLNISYGLPDAPLKPTETHTYSVKCLATYGLLGKGAVATGGTAFWNWLPGQLEQRGKFTLARGAGAVAEAVSSPPSLLMTIVMGAREVGGICEVPPPKPCAR